MGQFSMEIYAHPGSLLSDNQQNRLRLGQAPSVPRQNGWIGGDLVKRRTGDIQRYIAPRQGAGDLFLQQSNVIVCVAGLI